jgi:hydrogenase expression/formation protein HypD
MYPRCVTPGGNRRAQEILWRVFAQGDGFWRGIARVPGGDLCLRPEWAHVDARVRFKAEERLGMPATGSRPGCICGSIMSGLATPADCTLFGAACVPERPQGACMVSSEGVCRIWHEYGGRPETLTSTSPVGRMAT